MKPIQISFAKFFVLCLASLLGMALCFAMGFISGIKRRPISIHKRRNADEQRPLDATTESPTPIAKSRQISDVAPDVPQTLANPLASVQDGKPPISPYTDMTGSVSVPSQKSPIVPTWPSAPQSGTGLSSDWLSFVSDRLAELSPPDGSKPAWALGVVDFIDELKESDGEASQQEQAESAKLRESLTAFLTFHEYELLDSDTWDSAKQRAVAVHRSLDAMGPRILGKGSTGLARSGKVIRKQEVKLEQPGT